MGKFSLKKLWLKLIVLCLVIVEGCFASTKFDSKVLDEPIYQDSFKAKGLSTLIYQNKSVGPGEVAQETNAEIEEPKIGTSIIPVSTDSNIYIHDGIAYVKGEDKGKFSLSGYCACNKCGSGTGITASGKPVREAHTIASDWKVLPKGTVIILEDAVGKDGQVYDGVYVVEDRGGGVKNNHLDIYRPTHELASMVTHYGRAYGNVFIAEEYKPVKATDSNIIESPQHINENAGE